jgi:hypothetical protein
VSVSGYKVGQLSTGVDIGSRNLALTRRLACIFAVHLGGTRCEERREPSRRPPSMANHASTRTTQLYDRRADEGYPR